MYKIIRLIALSAITIVISSCATNSNLFNTVTYAKVEALQIGATKVDEYESLFGKPKYSRTLITSNGTFDTIEYSYVKNSVKLAGVALRALKLEFKDSILNAYAYNSNFEEDSTDFNFYAVREVKIGISSESDVIKYMGLPHGKGYCPTELFDKIVECKKGYKIFLWTHTSKLESLDLDSMKTKYAMVVFDENGKVVDLNSLKEH